MRKPRDGRPSDEQPLIAPLAHWPVLRNTGRGACRALVTRGVRIRLL